MEEKVKSFLEEGYDFIDESCSCSPLEFEETSKDIIVESKNGEKQRPFHILGVCKGVFQPINEPSRNFRIYDPDHWAYQISKPDIQERLQNRQMLGQIGHRDSRVDDATIARGEVSHVVTCMEIREDMNGKPYLYGELEILDTPAGRILKGLYEGGVGLFISSRGAGKLEDIPFHEGQDPRMKRVSKTSFFLETWDIVKAPGFLKARPVYESTISEPVKVQESISSDSLVSERIENKENIEENETLAHLSSQLTKLTKIVEKVVGDVYELPENVDSIEEGRKPGESDEEMKTRLHKELVHQADDKADRAREKGDWKEYEKQHDKLDKLDDISPVYNAYASEDLRKAAIPAVLKLLAESNISEESFSSIIDKIKKGMKG